MVGYQGLVLPVLGAMALAIQAILIRVATRGRRITDVLFVVLLVNVGLIVPLSVVFTHPDYGLTALSLVAFVCAGLVGTVLGRIALFTGIQRVGASRAEPVKGSTPFFAAIIAVAVLGERMTAPHFLGVVLIVLGVGMISWVQARDSAPAEVGSVTDLAFPLAAAMLFAIEPVFAKVGLNEQTPYLVGLAVKTVAATVGLTAYLWWTNRVPAIADLRTARLRWFVGAGVANTAFILALYASLSIAPVSLVVPIIQASPLFVVVLSFAFLRDIEHVTAPLAFGVCVVVAGGVLVGIYG